MKLEDQVCSLKLSKRLKELGVKQYSQFFWCPVPDNGEIKYYPVMNPAFKFPMIGKDKVGYDKDKCYSAFTVAELLESLPFSIRSGASFLRVKKNIESRYSVEYNESFEQTDIASCWDENLANALGKMLIYLIEQGIVKP